MHCRDRSHEKDLTEGFREDSMDRLESQRSWPKPITQRYQLRSESPNQDDDHEIQEHISLQYDLIRKRSIVSFAQSKYKIGKPMVCETRTKEERRASEQQTMPRDHCGVLF